MENVFSEQEEDYERSYLGSTASRTFSTNNFMPMQSRPPPGYTGHLRSGNQEQLLIFGETDSSMKLM